MTDALRTPFFIAAAVLIVIVVLLETGSALIAQTPTSQAGDIAALIPQSGPNSAELKDALANTKPGDLQNIAKQGRPPGLAIPYLAMLDGLVVFVVALIAASLFIPQRIEGRGQGCVTFIVALLILIASITFLFVAFNLLLLMVSLFLSVPFGTITYLALFGFFDRGGATVVLSFLLMLKLGFVVCLILAQQRFLENTGLVLLVLTSLLAGVIISFLHGFVPGFLVSITDALAAIIVAILAALWSIFFLIGSLPGIVKALRVDRA